MMFLLQPYDGVTWGTWRACGAWVSPKSQSGTHEARGAGCALAGRGCGVWGGTRQLRAGLALGAWGCPKSWSGKREAGSGKREAGSGKRRVQGAAWVGGGVWVRGTRCKYILVSSRTPSMAYDGPANPHTPAPDSGPVAMGTTNNHSQQPLPEPTTRSLTSERSHSQTRDLHEAARLLPCENRKTVGAGGGPPSHGCGGGACMDVLAACPGYPPPPAQPPEPTQHDVFCSALLCAFRF
ncbi:hypothetical protein M2421_001311 [Stenotrophomonas sp. BIGb0135]|nr:hypothetical protein [Stenotrophomonas sp. BIGb0135]